jgi:hypothetical protein
VSIKSVQLFRRWYGENTNIHTGNISYEYPLYWGLLPIQKKPNTMLLFVSTVLKHGLHFDYWKQPLNMCMLVCNLDCHEAGLCCYLMIHIQNLFRPLQLFYFHLWPIYWLSLLYKVLKTCTSVKMSISISFTITILFILYMRKWKEPYDVKSHLKYVSLTWKLFRSMYIVRHKSVNWNERQWMQKWGQGSDSHLLIANQCCHHSLHKFLRAQVSRLLH